MILLSLAVGAVSAVLLLPTLSDSLSGLWALGSLREPKKPRGTEEAYRLLFLVPAHDEEGMIGDCVRSIVGMDYPSDLLEVVVVADNCTDETPAEALDAGAGCFQRHDLDRPGKPWAIAWALERVRLADHDAVVIVDADTVVATDFASELARVESIHSKAVQAYCDVRNPQDAAVTRMSAVFASARYDFAYPLKQAAGINVPLMGNGMCFGSDVLQEHGWNAFSICEDWEMYALLTAAGVPIEGSRGARLFAEEARTLKQSGSQRQRWTAGKLTVLWQLAGTIARSRSTSWRQKLDLVAELTHTGPAAHLGLALILALGAAALRLPGAWWLIAALSLSVGRIVGYTLLALVRDPEPMKSVRAFAYLPFYTIWRLGVQIAALGMLGEARWVKTERND